MYLHNKNGALETATPSKTSITIPHHDYASIRPSRTAGYSIFEMNIVSIRWCEFSCNPRPPPSLQSRELCKNENVRGGPNFSAPFRIQQWSFLHNTRATRTFRPEVWRARMEIGDRPHMPRPLTRFITTFTSIHRKTTNGFSILFTRVSISSPTRGTNGWGLN